MVAINVRQLLYQFLVKNNNYTVFFNAKVTKDVQQTAGM